jgi:TatD DNase family protein
VTTPDAAREVSIVDVHAHIVSPEFDRDREQVLERARQAGVTAILAVGETLADAHQNLALAEQYDLLRPCAGLYPTYLDLEQCDQMVTFIRQHRERLFAIGEVGLDRWKVKEEADLVVQREIFSRFIDLSLELDLPLNIHSCSAGRHAVELLLEKNATRAVLHAFDGKASKAMPGVEAGYFFSVPPSIVRSVQKQKLVRQLPLECLLLETDSPVLGPERDERNEPANVRISARAIAEIKGVTEDEVLAVTRDNTRRLFRL